MEFLLYFLAGSIAIVILILKFDKKQTIKVHTVLKETRSIPPMFKLKETEQKIKTLKAALRFDDVAQNMANAASMANIYGNPAESDRYQKVKELKQLSAKYNNGLISLDTYNTKLDDLLGQLHTGQMVMAG